MAGACVRSSPRRRVGVQRSRRDEHAGHEDVLVDGGAGGAGGDARRVVLGFLFELDLLVTAVSAAECFLATAMAHGKNCSVLLNSDAEKNNYSVESNNAHIDGPELICSVNHRSSLQPSPIERMESSNK